MTRLASSAIWCGRMTCAFSSIACSLMATLPTDPRVAACQNVRIGVRSGSTQIHQKSCDQDSCGQRRCGKELVPKNFSFWSARFSRVPSSVCLSCVVVCPSPSSVGGVSPSFVRPLPPRITWWKNLSVWLPEKGADHKSMTRSAKSWPDVARMHSVDNQAIQRAEKTSASPAGTFWSPLCFPRLLSPFLCCWCQSRIRRAHLAESDLEQGEGLAGCFSRRT